MDRIDEVRTHFMDDVKEHKLIVLRDDGVYRHIRMEKPHSTAYYYDIVTYPEYLVISGDMGTYAFSRIEDMFRFFRRADLSINLGYWSEKCKAPYGGHKHFCAEEFRENLQSAVDVYKECVVEDEEDTVLSVLQAYLRKAEDVYTKEEAYVLIERILSDADIYDAVEYFTEVETDEYTYQYIWCLYAIVYAINMYDNVGSKTLTK